jgi:hypothetical protein
LVGLFAAAFTSPTLAATRVWKDVSGKFTIEAELIGVEGEEVILRNIGGAEIRVPLVKLSAADRRHLDSQRTTANAASEAAINLGPAKTTRIKIGMEIEGRGQANGIVGIVPVPMDWPEQTVKIVDEEKTSHVAKVTYRTLNDSARQMIINVPRLREGETARATVTFEVTRHALEGPKSTDGLRVPQRVDRDLRHYLQPGPLTEAKDAAVVAAKDKAVAGVSGAWEQVRAIHDFAVDHVRYDERDDIISAAAALKAGAGDCQELSSLFVAMCRAHGVPARCVWVPRHSYAEFYLEDAAGRGHWYPVESTNKEQFGFLPRTDIVMQKGDNFKVPELSEPTHYARTIIKGSFGRGGAQPEFREIMQILPSP